MLIALTLIKGYLKIVYAINDYNDHEGLKDRFAIFFKKDIFLINIIRKKLFQTVFNSYFKQLLVIDVNSCFCIHSLFKHIYTRRYIIEKLYMRL